VSFRKILEWPNSTLNKISKPVALDDPDLSSLLMDLYDTLNVESGLGIAAPQVGELKRVILIDLAVLQLGFDNPDKDSSPLPKESMWILLNPILEDPEGDWSGEEGCLSVPWSLASVKRHEKITLKYHTPSGEAKKMRLDPPLSIVVQHEVDHLNGKLYLDRLGRLSSGRIKKSIVKRRKTLLSMKEDLLRDPDEKKIGRPNRNVGLSKKELAKRKNNRKRNRN
jgi:peptide deformylase